MVLSFISTGWLIPCGVAGGASLLSRLLNKSGPSDAGGSLASSFAAQPLESSDGLWHSCNFNTNMDYGGYSGGERVVPFLFQFLEASTLVILIASIATVGVMK